MRKARFIAALAVVSMMLLAASAMPRISNGASKPLTIYMVGFTQQQAFWHAVQHGAEQAGKDFGATVKYEAPAGTGSDADMISLLDAAVAARPNGIAIEYAGRDMQEITLRALAAGIKVVLFNNNRFEAAGSTPATIDPRIVSLAFVGQDEHHSGEVLASAFLKYLPSGGGRVLVINPNPKSLVLGLRQDAVKGLLTARGYKPDVLVESADATQNQQTTGAYLQAHPDTVGILSLNVNGIAPAVQYVAQQKLKVPVAGFDINDVVFQQLRSAGALKILLDQQPYLQGYLTVENLVLELQHGFAPVNINTGSLIVDYDNSGRVEQLIKQGLD
ncbi:MAG TPA: substrate-binding domain-containing protein [bacterium]|nr:substrate-binding domain-containing protein [bacterium]